MKQETYENLEDFVQAAKSNDIKTIFFTLPQTTNKIVQMEGETPIECPHTVARLLLTGTTKDHKLCIVHNQASAEITITSRSTQKDIDEYQKQCQTRLDEAMKKIQTDFPSADLIAGFCSLLPQPQGA